MIIQRCAMCSFEIGTQPIKKRDATAGSVLPDDAHWRRLSKFPTDGPPSNLDHPSLPSCLARPHTLHHGWRLIFLQALG